MKTSNKLLTALAVSLILIPIIVIAVTVKLSYKEYVPDNRVATKNRAHFTTPSEGYVSIPLSKSFTAVNIGDAKGFFLNVQLVKDIKSGIKIPEEYKSLISYKIDENGVLQIQLIKQKNNNNPYAYIVIYSPTINQFSGGNGRGIELTFNTDSLRVNATSLFSLTLNSASKFDNLNISTDEIKTFSISNAKAGNIQLNLNNSNFTSELSSYKSLKIDLTGNSDVEIMGEEPNKNKFQIDNLYIKTAGKSDLKVENIKVNKSTGSLSDSTSVSMSASILKTMFNK